MTTLTITALHKSYLVKDQPFEVLKALQLTAPCDEITVILGESGCGKTTLLRLISGLEKQDDGTISFSEPTKLGMVFQEARLMPWLNVKENICFGLRAPAPARELAELIATVGLTGFEEALPATLSGGMQQRVSLARALILHSKLLLMDEPFAALDYFTRRKMQQELLRIKAATKTGIILVTHNIDEALTLADKIMVMQNGLITKIWQLPANKQRDILSEPYIQFKRDILNTLHVN